VAKQGKTGLLRIYQAFFYSMAGFKAAWQNEAAFRQEVLLTLAMIPAALWLGDTPLEKIVLIGCLVLVLLAELFNSAIEAVVDRIGTEKHDLSGRAKDIGSAAVFLTLTWAAIVWLVILFF
jgi:diacylglycerol kinase (ATP)